MESSTPVRRKVRKKPRLGYFEQKALQAAKEAAAAAATSELSTPDGLRKSESALSAGGGALHHEQDLKSASFAELVYLVQSGRLGGEEALSSEDEARKMRDRSASEQIVHCASPPSDERRRASESQAAEKEEKEEKRGGIAESQESATDAPGKPGDAWETSEVAGGACTWGDRMEEELKREKEKHTPKKTAQKAKKAKKAKKKRKKSKGSDLTSAAAAVPSDMKEFQFPQFDDGPKEPKETVSDGSTKRTGPVTSVKVEEERAPGLVAADKALELAAAAVLASKKSRREDRRAKAVEEAHADDDSPLLETDSWEKLYDSPTKEHKEPKVTMERREHSEESSVSSLAKEVKTLQSPHTEGSSISPKDSLLAGAMAQLQEWKHSDSGPRTVVTPGSEVKLEEAKELVHRLASAAGVEERQEKDLEEETHTPDEGRETGDTCERTKSQKNDCATLRQEGNGSERQRKEDVNAETCEKQRVEDAKTEAEARAKAKEDFSRKEREIKKEEERRRAEEKEQEALREKERSEEERRVHEQEEIELRERKQREEAERARLWREKKEQEERERERKEKEKREKEKKEQEIREKQRREKEKEEARREEEARMEEERRKTQRQEAERREKERREKERREKERRQRERREEERREEERREEERIQLQRMAEKRVAEEEAASERKAAMKSEEKNQASQDIRHGEKGKKRAKHRNVTKNVERKASASSVSKLAGEEKERKQHTTKRVTKKAHNTVRQKASRMVAENEGSVRETEGDLIGEEAYDRVERISQQSEAAAVLFIVLLGFYLANYDYQVPLRGLMSAGEAGRILHNSPLFSWLSWQLLSDIGTRNCVILFKMLTAFIVTASAIIFHGTLLRLMGFSPRSRVERYFPLFVSLSFGLGTSTYALVGRFSTGLYESLALFCVVSGVYLYTAVTEMSDSASVGDVPSAFAKRHKEWLLIVAGGLLSAPVFLEGSLVVLPLCFSAHLLLSSVQGSSQLKKDPMSHRRKRSEVKTTTRRLSFSSCVLFFITAVVVIASAHLMTTPDCTPLNASVEVPTTHSSTVEGSPTAMDSQVGSVSLSLPRRVSNLLVFLFSPSGGVFTFSPILFFAFVGLSQALVSERREHSSRGILLTCASVATLYLLICGLSGRFAVIQGSSRVEQGLFDKTATVLTVPFLLLLVGNALTWVTAKNWRISLFVTLSLCSIAIQLIASGPALEEGRWERKALYHIYSPHSDASERTLLHSTSDSALAARLGEYLVLDIETQNVSLPEYRYRMWSLTDSLIFDIVENWRATVDASRESAALFEAAMDTVIAQNLERETLQRMETETLPVEDLTTVETQAKVIEERENVTDTETNFAESEGDIQGMSAAELFGKPQRVIHFLYVGADEGVNLGHEACYSNFVSYASAAGAERGVRVVVTPLRMPPPIDSTMGCATAAAALAFVQVDYGQYDGVVIGGGSTIAEHYLCPLQVDGALGHFPHLPIMFFGSGFDDLSLITADKNVMRQLRQGRFDAISFGRTSGLVTQVGNLLERSQLFGGFRGSYSEKFVEKMATAISSDVSLSLSERTGLRALGDAGLLSGQRLAADPDLGGIRLKYGIPSGQRYVMINYGSPSEGTRHMYGKGSQLLGTSLDMLINDLSQQFVVVLYSTSTSDLDSVISLKEIVTTVGVNPSRVVAIPIVPTVPEVLSLLRETELHIGFRLFSSVLSVVAKCPFVAIAYRFKTVEFMDSVGLSQFVVTTGDCTYSSLQIMSRRAMENREKFVSAADAAIAHATDSYTTQLREFVGAAMRKRGLTHNVASPPPQLDSPPLRVLYVGSVGQEQRSTEAAFVFRAFGTALTSALDWKSSLASIPLEMETFTPTIGHLQPPSSPRAKAQNPFGRFDMDEMLQWLDAVEMEQLYPVPWGHYHLVVFANTLFPEPVMEQFLISFISFQRETEGKGPQLLFWGNDCDIHRMFDDVVDHPTNQAAHLTSDDIEHWKSVHDLDRQLLSLYNDVLPSVLTMSSNSAEKTLGTHRQLPLCTRGLDERISLLYQHSLLSSNITRDEIRQMGLDGSTVAAASLLTDITAVPTHTVTGERRLPTLSSMPHFIRKRLPIDLTRSSAPIIGLHYAAISDSEHPGLSGKDRKAIFGRRVADNVEALTSICKAVQHLSDDGYTIVLFTSAVGGIRGEQPLDDLKSMWSFIRAGAEQHSSVQRNVVLLTEVLDVSYLTQLLGSFEIVLSVGGDYSGAAEAQSHFPIGLSLSLDVPVFHLASGNSGVELMHALDLPDWVLPLQLLKSGSMLHSILTHLLLDRDPYTLTEELVVRTGAYKANALNTVLLAAEGALL